MGQRIVSFQQEYANHVHWHCGACQHFMHFDYGAGERVQCPECKAMHRVLWGDDGKVIQVEMNEEGAEA